MTTVYPATVVEIPFKNGQTNWDYKLYVRVEKVASAAAGGSRVGTQVHAPCRRSLSSGGQGRLVKVV